MTNESYGKLLETVDPNGAIILKVSGFLVFLSFVLFHFGSGTQVALGAALGGLGIGAYLYIKKDKNWIRIYEKGIEVQGPWTTGGFFPYSRMDRFEWEEDIYRFLGVIPIFKYMNLGVYGKNNVRLTTLCSIFYGDMEVKMRDLEAKQLF